MGKWASYVVRRGDDEELDDGYQLDAVEGWQWWEFPVLDEEPLIQLVGTGAAVSATVADSDMCVVTGWDGGQEQWEWVFGEVAYAEAAAAEGLPAPDPEELAETLPERAAALAVAVVEWAKAAGLSADVASVTAVLETDHDIAEDGLQAVLGAVGIVDS
jgi:hypothetical protein